MECPGRLPRRCDVLVGTQRMPRFLPGRSRGEVLQAMEWYIQRYELMKDPDKLRKGQVLGMAGGLSAPWRGFS